MAEEKKLQTKILRDLEQYEPRLFCFKIMKANRNGIPDVFFISSWSGTVFIEVKAPGKTPSENQTINMRWLNECGAHTFACDTWEKWSEIKRLLNFPPPR